jgi:hypothetical protein
VIILVASEGALMCVSLIGNNKSLQHILLTKSVYKLAFLSYDSAQKTIVEDIKLVHESIKNKVKEREMLSDQIASFSIFLSGHKTIFLCLPGSWLRPYYQVHALGCE